MSLIDKYLREKLCDHCQRVVRQEEFEYAEQFLPQYDHRHLWGKRMRAVHRELQQRVLYLGFIQHHMGYETMSPPTTETVQMHMKYDEWSQRSYRDQVVPETGLVPGCQRWLWSRTAFEAKRRKEEEELKKTMMVPQVPHYPYRN